ncbi:MAG TPA: sensor histidine kinase, partial [Streptosporangiaceae bacterium]|nr:sensor histidine kinase [Streptosporangiaceae bacterium]
TDPMMVRVYWLMRVTAFAVIGILALISPPHSAVQRAVQVACFSVVGLALLAWIAVDLRPRYRARGLPVALGVMAIAGGVAAVTSGSGQTLVAFACIAAFWAGSETDLPASIAVAVAGIVSIWVAGGIADSNFGTMAGDPLLLAVCTMFGLQRRSYRVQAEQSAALLAQHERLRAEQRRADVLDERTRIAREIHDVLAHSLGALGIQIQAARAILTDHGDVDRAVEALTTAQRMAADGLTETRRAVHALRVDTLPLDEELAAVVDTHRQRYHVPVTLETSGLARALPPDATLALLRTAQEAMVNAAKHAPGQRVAVRLDYDENDVRLSVVNGLDGADASVRRPGDTGGYGLTGMRERLRLLDGTLRAGPKENDWTVTAELPLAAAADGIAR